MRACAHSVELFVDVHVVIRHAIVDVQYVLLIRVVIGVHIVVLSVPLVGVHFVVPILILYQFMQLFSRNHFSHMFSLYSHGILGVVFTHPVGYSRPPSPVNDPTVTKQVNSRKSCLEEVSQLLIFIKFPLINQYWVRLHDDFHRNKESTMILASSTKTKNSFVSIVGFVELLLLFPSIAARLTMLV